MLYAHDTSFIITNPSPIEFANKLNKIFADVNEWFKNNLLSPRQLICNFEQRTVKNLIQTLHY